MKQVYWDKMSKTYQTEIFDVFKNDTNGTIQSCISELASPRKIVGDVGCAVGKWLPFLSPQFKKVYAIDFSKECLAYAERDYKALKNIEYLALDAAKPGGLPYQFDVALCVNAVITDLDNKRKIFFKNLFDCIKPKGYLILVVPSFESSLYSDAALKLWNQKDGTVKKAKSNNIDKKKYQNFKQGILDIDHVPTKHYLREELILTLQDLGFEVKKTAKAEYSWKTEYVDPPKWLKSPYQWDWVVVAQKIGK